MSEALDLRLHLHRLEPQRINVDHYFTRRGHIRTFDNGTTLRPYHIERKPQPADLERCALVSLRSAAVNAQRSLRTMRLAVAGLDIAGYVFTWLDLEIREVQRDLAAIRRATARTADRLGLTTEAT